MNIGAITLLMFIMTSPIIVVWLTRLIDIEECVDSIILPLEIQALEEMLEQANEKTTN